MRKTTLLYAPILACMALFSLAFSAWADVALPPPPRYLAPYDKEQEAHIWHRISEMSYKDRQARSRMGATALRHHTFQQGEYWEILLSMSGPCDYEYTLHGPKGKIIAQEAGSLEEFGPHKLCLSSIDLQKLKMHKGETRRYRLTVSGNFYNYEKIKDETDKRLRSIKFSGQKIIGDPNYRYELIDKKGKPFSFDIDFTVAKDQNGNYSITSPIGELETLTLNRLTLHKLYRTQ